MSEDFLSQDEVDALLRGVSSDPDEPEEKPDHSGIRPYNLATQERIVRGRMPTLEIINQRFARQFRVGLFNFMRRTADISVGPVRVLKYSEFVRNLVVPTNLNLVHIKPLRGTALFIFDTSLVFLVVDNLFGGDSRFHTRVEGRDFTQTEQRIIRRLLDLAFEVYAKSWQPIYPVEFEYVRAEMNTQFANVATPNEVVVTTTFNIEFGPAGGEFHVCIPYAMIEPVRDLLSSSLQDEALEVDKRRARLLSQQVQAAEVDLVVDLAEIPVTFRQILNMRAGDVIPMEVPETVTAKVDGVPVIEGRFGVSNGQYALRVQKIINHSASETGEQHA